MSVPAFSVVMCNHNYGRYLEEAIHSVLNQDFENFELIIVDDGSTDQSVEIIKRCTDTRIVPLFKENGGQASALNEGYSAARGEIIAFLDSDDYWYRSKLRILNDVFKAQEVVAVQHSLELVDGASNALDDLHPARPQKDGVSDILSWVMRHHSYPVGAPTSALAFRRRNLQRIFPLNLQWRYCADIPLRLAFLLGWVWNTKAILGTYRIHDNNGWWNTENLDRKRAEVMKTAEAELLYFLAANNCQFRPVRCLSDSLHAEFRLHYGLQLARAFRVIQKFARVLYDRLYPLDPEVDRAHLFDKIRDGESSYD